MASSVVGSATTKVAAPDHVEMRPALPINVLSYAVLAGGATTIALAIYVAVLGHSKLPFWDEWMQIDFAANEGPGHTLDWLWRQFNQHRVLVPKLFLLADLRWFRATQTSQIVSNLCIQFAHLSLLAWSLRVLGAWRGALWRTAVGLLAFCLFNPSQWQNLVMGFTGLCNFLPPVFASLSVVELLLYWRESQREAPHARRWLYLALCVIAAAGATLSLSNGNLVWPLLVIAALALRVRIVAIATIVGVAVAGICAFFYNYTVYITPSSLSSRAEIIALLKYIAVYFGSSWVTSNVRAAECLGIAGELTFLFIQWRLPRWFRAAPAVCVQFGVLLLFVLATGVVTAPGRVVFGLDQAFSGRYQSFALLFWGSMGVLALGRVAARGPAAKQFLVAQAALLAIMLFAATKTEALLAKVRWQGFNINLAAAALETGAPDDAQLAWAHSHPDYPRSLTPFLRDHRLSVFTDPEPFLLGVPLDAKFQVAPSEECVGGVGSLTALSSTWPRALRISGWAWNAQEHAAPSAILVTTDGLITGLGVVGDASPARVVAGRPIGSFSGFQAYVRDVSRTNKLDVYGVSRKFDNMVCHIAVINPASVAP